MAKKTITRRSFLKSTTSAAIGFGAAATFPGVARARTAGANDTINVAVVGVNFGRRHIRRVIDTAGARLAAICDLDPQTLRERHEELKAADFDVFATTEYRELLERRDIDAVMLATPNHWHALQTIWACQAGKDVYVEKPVAHTIWEGRQMVAAARRYNRIVQAGTQGRSAEGLPELIEFLKEGHLGKIRYLRCRWARQRGSIGRRLPWYPYDINYDVFCGKSAMSPLERNRLHYDWHWMWETGNGDHGNLGIHVFDRARWVSGHGSPSRVISLGGRFNLDDAGETPNAQLTICNYPDFPIFIETPSLPAHPEADGPAPMRGIRNGFVVECEGGYFAGNNGGQAFDSDGNLLREFPGGGTVDHFSNFLGAIRSRKSDDLNAAIDVAHASNNGCLLGNLSYRLGNEASLDEIRATVGSHDFIGDILEDFIDYCRRYGVDPDQTPLQLGNWVDFNPQTEIIERVDGADDDPRLEKANFLLKGTHRPPYQFPAINMTR